MKGLLEERQAVWGASGTSSSLSESNEGAREAISVIAMCARTQTGGVGQRGRVWHSPAGGLWMTVAVMDARGAGDRGASEPWRSLAIGVEVAQELSARWPAKLQGTLKLKWPNDLVCEQEGVLCKCGGILCERVTDGHGAWWWVVGIGINVANATGDVQQQVGRGVRSLLELGCVMREEAQTIDELFVAITTRVVAAMEAASFAVYRERYEERMWGMGQRGFDVRGAEVRSRGDVCEVVGIDADGWLRVKTASGEVRSVRGFEWGGEATSDERREKNEEK